MEIYIENSEPQIDEFIKLRADVGWGETPNDLAKAAIKNSLFHVVARKDKKLIGMARVVGDGAMFFYIQDLIVSPDFQNNGIGNLLMQSIESYLSQVALSGSTIGLFSAKGKESFYLRYGYSARTGSPLGLGMCKFV